MTVDTQDLELKLIRRGAGVELTLEPLQGLWTEQQYLKLTDQSNHVIEFTDGVLEVVAMPTRSHQLMLLLLYGLLNALMRPAGGIVLVAPLRMQVRPGAFREPDILLLLDTSDARNQDAYWLGADLVVEIVSPDKPTRDTEEKVADYAAAQIPEYWIVNPIEETITVLTLDGDAYIPHGVFRRGAVATSRLVASFSVSVDSVLNAS